MLKTLLLAAQSLCPLTFQSRDVTNPITQEGGRVMAAGLCRSDSCMAWRAAGVDGEGEKLGYCGMAGMPAEVRFDAEQLVETLRKGLPAMRAIVEEAFAPDPNAPLPFAPYGRRPHADDGDPCGDVADETLPGSPEAGPFVVYRSGMGWWSEAGSWTDNPEAAVRFDLMADAHELAAAGKGEVKPASWRAPS